LLLKPTSDVVFNDDLVVVRKTQVSELYNMLNPNTKVNTKLDVEFFGDPLKYIWGWKGTGKTTMLRWFERKVQGMEIKFIYLNCRVYATPSKLIDEIGRRFNALFPDFVSSEVVDRAIIADYVKYINDKQVFLILDEIDKPLRNSKTTQPDEFLHFLIRLVNENKKNLFKVVFSTNIVNIERFLSDEVISFLSGSKIVFGVYSVPEMVSILEKRAKKALINGSYEKKDLIIISNMTHEAFDGDIRTALNMLNKLANKSKEKLDMTKLNTVLNEINFEFLRKEVLSFPRGAQILLKSLLIRQQGQGVEYNLSFDSEEGYKQYVSFCNQEQYKATQKAMFYRYLQALQDSMIINKTSKGYIISENPKKLQSCLNTII